MRETSYHAVIAEMTVRALWELQNLLDCIPDALWDRCYGGAPLWQHVYHTLHELDQWFINPRDTDFVEPPIHTPHLQELHIYPAVRLDRPAIDDYFYTIKAKLSIYRRGSAAAARQLRVDAVYADFVAVSAFIPPHGHGDGLY